MFTFLFGLISLGLLPRSPAEASFLTLAEKEFIIYTLDKDGLLDTDDYGFSWRQVMDTFTKPHVLIVITAGFFNGTHMLARWMKCSDSSSRLENRHFPSWLDIVRGFLLEVLTYLQHVSCHSFAPSIVA